MKGVKVSTDLYPGSRISLTSVHTLVFLFSRLPWFPPTSFRECISFGFIGIHKDSESFITPEDWRKVCTLYSCFAIVWITYMIVYSCSLVLLFCSSIFTRVLGFLRSSQGILSGTQALIPDFLSGSGYPHGVIKCSWSSGLISDLDLGAWRLR